MKKIKQIILTFSLVCGIGLLAIPAPAHALDVWGDACSGDAANTAVCKDKDKDQAPSFIKTLVNALLYVLGAVSVIVIIFAGIFYTTSIGDAALITKAKNTLLYAVIGLVVAMLAYAIVNFVLGVF
ncbi:MAG: pilin [Thiobacillus sp.]